MTAALIVDVFTLRMVCWRARVALALLVLSGILDLLRYVQ